MYDLVQGKEGLRGHTNINHVSEVSPPFLRHTEGCRAVGMIWNKMRDNQLSYGLYYHMYLGQSAALRFGGGISPVKLKEERSVRWVVTPSLFLYI